MYNAIATEPFFVLRLVVSLRLAYDFMNRITSQRRGANVNNKSGGEYVYYQSTNKLKSVANGMGGSADKRDMSASDNFEYDAEGNMTKDYCKDLTIAYDWRGMPVEFKRQNSCYDIHEKIVCDSTKLVLRYDGSGRRVSKTRYSKNVPYGYWTRDVVTHYTGIGTEVRETHVNGQDETKVVVNMPQGLGRYMPEDAVDGLNGVSGSQLAGYRPPAKFEWYLKNHLGSTMLVYGTSAYNDPYASGYKGSVKAAYDYRATVVAMRTKQQVAKCCPPFGEQVDLTMPTDKVTENFTGKGVRGERCGHACMYIAEPKGLGAKRKEKDDETQLNYFGARYFDPMLGLWTSVDPAGQFSSPYLYAGNGVNPVNGVDEDGNELVSAIASAPTAFYNLYQAEKYSYEHGDSYGKTVLHGLAAFGGTILAAAALGPSSLGGAMAYGAASRAVVNGAEQALFKDEISASEVAEAAWDGAMTSVFSFAGKATMGTQALGDGFFVIGEAAGATASIPVIKNTPDMSSDSNLNKCQDR